MKTYIIALPSDSTKMLCTEYSFARPYSLANSMDIAIKFDSKEAAEHLINSIKSNRVKKGDLTWDEVNALHVIEVYKS